MLPSPGRIKSETESDWHVSIRAEESMTRFVQMQMPSVQQELRPAPSTSYWYVGTATLVPLPLANQRSILVGVECFFNLRC